MDYTRLLNTLQPRPDGESAVRHRSAVVDAVNSDGTVDLDFDGTIVASVSVLDGALTDVGDVVQVAAWAGDLLVLGRARSSDDDLGGLWTTWTPTLSNLTVGNGTHIARYTRIGDLVAFYWRLTLGNSSSVGTGPTITLPVAAHASVAAASHIAQGYVQAGGTQYPAVGGLTNSTTIRPLVFGSAGATATIATLTATSPATFTTNDDIILNGVYEAA